MKARILVVDDSQGALDLMERHLRPAGYGVVTALSVDEAIRALASASFDLVITDLKMPRVGGMALVRHVRENYEDLEVMMVTGYATVEGAVEAVKAGAEEYLQKPFTSEELFAALERVFAKATMRRALRQRSEGADSSRHGLIGQSAAMGRVLRTIEKAARTRATVLITGESGTGKELVARAIHYSGERAAAPFVPVNCAGIPENLLESELFGHVKGAFTGATESRAGFFQTADGGTIFLDEVGETGAAMQAKLLRVLQDRQVGMVGSSRTREVDVRILAATNKNLESLVRRGSFREDLFFRLNVVTIELPPLRERDDDVLLLARHFLVRHCAELGRETPLLSDAVLDALRAYPWPGNVRELDNLMQRMAVMSEGEIVDMPDLPHPMRHGLPTPGGALRPLAEVEREHVRRVLELLDGNKSRAAQVLGIDRKTLRAKLAD